MTRAVILLLLVHVVLAAAAPATPAQESAAGAFRAGVAAQQDGQLERAAQAYRRAIAADPRLAEAHANLGAVLARLGQYEEAVASYERALAINPRLNAARLNLGLAHYRAGALGAAADAFRAAHAADPSLLQARQLLGLVLVEIGKDAEALPHLEASAQAAPDEPAVLFALGRAYSRLGDKRADTVAERLGQTPEGRPLWHQLRGLVLQQGDRHEQALQAFDAAAALNDTLPRLFTNIGVSRLKLGDHAGARRAFETALARSDRDAAAHVYVAWLDEQADRLTDAQRHAERAVTLDGDLAESRGLLGRVLLKQGSTAAAASHLERAVAAEPENASWRFLLGQAHQRMGNAEAAAREFAEARRLKEQEVARDRKVDR
ncbi:MAG: tetratricopeptide repeat protein [Vicinamibacterales bacterium]